MGDPKKAERLSLAEVEVVLRRAAELSARRRGPLGAATGRTVSPEVLVRAAANAGIHESDVRRALFDLYSEKAAEPDTLAKRLYGTARLRSVREVERPTHEVWDHLEDILKREQGLRLRRKTEASSLWDAGDLLGAVRRALDFSGDRPLLKARSIELRVEGVGDDDGRSGANLTADVANQRSDYLSLAGLLGAIVALPLALAGFADWPYFLAAPPAIAASGFGFRLAYRKVCADVRRALDDLLDAAEEGPSEERGPEERRPSGPPGRIKRLKPIPRFAHPPDEDE